MIRVNNNKKNSCLMSLGNFKPKKSVIVVVAAMLMSGVATTAYAATLDNSASASGTYNDGTIDHPVATTETSDVSVDLAAPTRGLTVAVAPGVPTNDQASGGNDSTLYPDGGDTITVVYTVTNSGNITENGISVTAALPTFIKADNTSSTASGTIGATLVSTTGHANVGATSVTTLAPDESVDFTATYTMDYDDAFLNVDVDDGVKFTATASSTTSAQHSDGETSLGGEGTTEIPAVTKLVINKSAFNGAGVDLQAGATPPTVDVNEVITYRYEVGNYGNVPLTDVSVSDVHGNAGTAQVTWDDDQIRGETDDTDTPPLKGDNDLGTDEDNGIVDTLAIGGTVHFSYAHTVTEAEINPTQ